MLSTELNHKQHLVPFVWLHKVTKQAVEIKLSLAHKSAFFLQGLNTDINGNQRLLPENSAAQHTKASLQDLFLILQCKYIFINIQQD